MAHGKAVDRVAPALAVLGDHARLRILTALGDEERRAGDLAAHLGMSEPLVSFHLRRLLVTGLVRAQRRGQRVYYVADGETARVLLADLALLLRVPTPVRC